MLIGTQHGPYIESSQIKFVRHGKNGRPAEVELVNGERHETNLMFDLLQKTLSPIIAASPGYEMLFPTCNDSKFDFGREPVVAWRVHSNCTLWPLTVSNGPDESDDWVLLRPNGEVDVIGCQTFANIDDWVASKKHELAERIRA
jgi:hypothetical protein